MRRVGIRIANIGLFTLCCFLVASVFNNISAELLMVQPAVTPTPPGVESRQVRSWEERRPIIERNLFGAKIVAAPASPPPPAEEDLEETALPLRLLGTVASANPATSRAAIEDKASRKHEVVRLGDFLQSYEQVEVAAIERGRVVLLNEDRREQLRLQEDTAETAPAPRRTLRRSRRRRSGPSDSALEGLADRLKDLQGENGLNRRTTDLLSQGRLMPEYSDGQMIGMQIDDIEPGSLYEKVGLKDGDVITSVNGIAIDSPAASGRILSQFTRADEFEIKVRDSSQPIIVTPEQLAEMLDN